MTEDPQEDDMLRVIPVEITLEDGTVMHGFVRDPGPVNEGQSLAVSFGPLLGLKWSGRATSVAAILEVINAQAQGGSIDDNLPVTH